MSPKQEDHIIWHQSGINPGGKPFVQLLKDDQVIGQMSPQQAREHAQAIVEAAEAAEQDAFLWHFAREKLLIPEQEAYGLILQFRKFREQTTGKSQGPTRPTDWIMPPADAGLNFPKAVRNALERAVKNKPTAFDDPINKDICPDCGTVFFVVKSEIRFCPHCGFRWASAS